jgi:hypothetical protein
LPHGLAFAKPVTISVPFTGGASDLLLLTAQPGGEWTIVANSTVSGTVITAQVMHFSFFVIARRMPKLEGGADVGRTADAAAGADTRPAVNDARDGGVESARDVVTQDRAVTLDGTPDLARTVDAATSAPLSKCDQASFGASE